MHYDSSLEIDLQIRDRFRDLLEADSIVQAVYPSPKIIGSLPLDDVSESAGIAVALTYMGGQANIAAAQTYDTHPRFLLTVQWYTDPSATGNQEAAQTGCANAALAIRRAILSRYRSEPGPLAAPDNVRLWDQLEMITPNTTEVLKVPGKFWYVETHFRVLSYNRNSL